jgi:hypothetical protein
LRVPTEMGHWPGAAFFFRGGSGAALWCATTREEEERARAQSAGRGRVMARGPGANYGMASEAHLKAEWERARRGGPSAKASRVHGTSSPTLPSGHGFSGITRATGTIHGSFFLRSGGDELMALVGLSSRRAACHGGHAGRARVRPCRPGRIRAVRLYLVLSSIVDAAAVEAVRRWLIKS